MDYNLQNNNEILAFKDKCEYFLKLGKTVELKEKKNTRTNKQNRALHLLFTIMSEQLNEMGMTYNYQGLKGQVIETRFTPHIIKEFYWRPVQVTMFEVKSTTKINTTQINEIVDVFSNWFGEKGIVIQFPSKEQIKNLIENE